MTPEAITLLFKEATEAFTLIDGNPTDDDLLAIRETLLQLHMDIPFNHLPYTPGDKNHRGIRTTH